MGNIVHDKPVITFICDDALVSGGFALTFGTTSGHVRKAGSNDKVIGIALTNTRDVITGIAKSGEYVGVVKFSPGLVVKLQLEKDNQTISFGDPLAVTNDETEKGCVDKRDGVNETGEIIAYALEDVTSNTGGTILAILR